MKNSHDPLASQEDLFHRVLDGGGTQADLAALHQLLCQNESARDAWIRLTHLHAELASGVLLEGRAELRNNREKAQETKPADFSEQEKRHSHRADLPWRRRFGRVAAALGVGLLLGGFGTSLLRAVIEPRSGKVALLLADSFEAQLPPRGNGPPGEAGVWGGDRTELVGEQQGVRPRSGQRMLRFVSATFEGKPQESDSYIADVHRLVDLRPFSRELSAGDVTLRFTAHFNAHSYPDAAPYTTGVYLHAITQETLRKNVLHRTVHELVEESLGVSVSNTPLDRDPATWQRATAELRLPPQTEFVWVHLTLTHPLGRSREGPRTFSGHFLDDLEASLVRRTPDP